MSVTGQLQAVTTDRLWPFAACRDRLKATQWRHFLVKPT
jgi:hypothetical protein